MANHKQAIKRHRQSLQKRERNAYYTATVRSYLKKARTALEAKDKPAAEDAVRLCLSYCDHIAGKGIIHRNKASRLRSRLTRQLNAI